MKTSQIGFRGFLPFLCLLLLLSSSLVSASSFEAFLREGQTLLRAGKYLEASEQLSQAFALAPQDRRSLAEYQLGVALVFARKYEKAKEIFTSFSSDKKKLGDVGKTGELRLPYYLGICETGLGNHTRARELFEEYLQSDPEPTPEVYNQYGMILSRLEEHEAAEAYLRKAVDLGSPSQVPVYQFNLGEELFKQRRFPEAYAVFQETAAHEKLWEGRTAEERARLRYYLGNSAFMVRKNEEAEQLLESVVNDSTASDEIRDLSRFYLAIVNLDMGKYESARVYFEKAQTGVLAENLKITAANIQRVFRTVPTDKPWSIYTSFGVQNDTNVILDPVDSPIDPNQDSGATTLLINPNIYLPLWEEIILNASLASYLVLYFDRELSSNDLFNQSISLGVTYPFNLSGIDFQVNSNYRLNLPFFNNDTGKDLFYVSNTFETSLYAMWSEAMVTQLLMSISDLNIVESPPFPRLDQDGTTYLIGQNQIVYWFGTQWQTNLGYSFFADTKEGDDFEARNHRLTLGISTPVLAKFQGGFNVNLTWSDYPQNSEDRDDFRQDYLWYVFYQAKSNMGFSFTSNLVLNDSDVDRFSFHRLIVESGVYYQF
ncbi:tetratricopeptide repeat protein [Bdellovibrionota bacterium]